MRISDWAITVALVGFALASTWVVYKVGTERDPEVVPRACERVDAYRLRAPTAVEVGEEMPELMLMLVQDVGYGERYWIDREAGIVARLVSGCVETDRMEPDQIARLTTRVITASLGRRQ